jgi:hypothetical protein
MESKLDRTTVLEPGEFLLVAEAPKLNGWSLPTTDVIGSINLSSRRSNRRPRNVMLRQQQAMTHGSAATRTPRVQPIVTFAKQRDWRLLTGARLRRRREHSTEEK